MTPLVRDGSDREEERDEKIMKMVVRVGLEGSVMYVYCILSS